MPVHGGEHRAESEARIKAEAELKLALASLPDPERKVLECFYSSVTELSRKRASKEILESTQFSGLTSLFMAAISAVTKERKFAHPEGVAENIDARSVSYLIENPVVEVLMAAAAAFQEVGAERLWLSTPTRAFDDKPPLAVMATAEGRKMILNELGLIEHGMF